MKLRLPLLLRLALLSTAAAYTLGSGCLFADDAPADAAQDDPIAEAVDEEESDSPAIGFEGYTESQLVDIQSSDSAGSVIRQMLENSTTGAVANVGTTSSTSNGATAAAESPALTLSAPAEPVTDTTLTTSTLSDSAGEGAVAPFFSAEEAAALVVASPATSTPSVKNASTATLSSSDASDETTASSSATGASSSIASVGSAGGAGASSGGGASYSLTSSAPDSSSSSLVITTPTDDTSSDPIAEDVLEDSSTEDTTTSTLPDSSVSTLATTTSTSATTRSLPALKLLGAAGDSVTVVDANGGSHKMGELEDPTYGIQYYSNGTLGDTGKTGNIVYLKGSHPLSGVKLSGSSFWICPGTNGASFGVKELSAVTPAAAVKIQNNEWHNQWKNGNLALTLNIETLSVKDSASLEVNQTHDGVITVSIGKVVNSSTEATTGPLLTSVFNSGTLTLGTNANDSASGEASSVSIGTLKNTGTMTLNGAMTITGSFSNEGKLTNNGTLTLGSGSSLNLDQFQLYYNADNISESGVSNVAKSYFIAWGNGTIQLDEGASFTRGGSSVSGVTASGNCLILKGDSSESCYVVASNDSYSNVLQEISEVATVVVKKGVTLSGVESLSTQNICGDGTVQIAGNILYENGEKLDGVFGTIEVGSGGILDFGGASSGLSYADNVKIFSGGKLTASGADFTRSFELAGGELTSSGNETYSGTITISSASTVSSSKDGTTTLSGTLTGDSKLTISGDGTVQLFGDVSNFSGLISVESGTLQFKVGTKAGQNGSTVSVAKGATLDINGFYDTCFAVKLDGGTLKNGGSDCGEGKRQINEISLMKDSKLQADKKFGLVASDYGVTTMNLAGHTLTKSGSADFFACKATLKGGGTLKIEEGTFSLGNSNGAGWLGDTNSSAANTNIWLLDGATLSGEFTMNHAAEFKLDDENAGTEGNATISANINLKDKQANFTVAKGDILTVSGNLTSESGGEISKSGAGVLELAGTNSFANLSVSGGKVQIRGTTTLSETGTLRVDAGGTLVGSVSGGSTFTLNGVWDLTGVNAYDSGQLASYLGKVSSGSGALKFAAAGSSAYVLGGDVNTKGLDLAFVGSEQKQTEINGWQNTNSVLIVSSGSTLSTVDELRVESTATVKVESGGIVEVGGVLNLGHEQSGNYGHFLLDGGQLIAQEVGRTNGDDAVDSSKNTFRMSGGTLTLTKENAEISGVYTEISRGTLDTSKAAWGITSSAVGSVSVGGVTVSDAYMTEAGTTNNSGYALTLTGVNITDNITLEGTAGLSLKNVTITGESVTLGGDGKSVTSEGILKVQENATLKLNTGETSVTTITNRDGSTEAASISGGVTMRYDSDSGKAVIAGAGNGSVATISNAAIDVAAGSKLELSNVVLAESTWLHDEETTGDGGSTSPYTGSVDLNGVEGKVTGTGKDGGSLQTGTVLTKTGTTGSGEGAILALQSDAKVFKIAYSQITQMASVGGNGLTLDFNSYDGGKGFASLYETLNGKYDYVAIEFASTVGEINFSTLEVNAKITNGDDVTGTTTGYYVGGTNGVVNSNGTSGVVVYFDAIALPEPTTSTLGLLALAALCARRHRSRTRAHAEHA